MLSSKQKKLKTIETIFHYLFWVAYFFYPLIMFGEYHTFEFNLQKAIVNTTIVSISVYLIYFLYKRNQHNVLLIVSIGLLLLLFIYMNCKEVFQNCNCISHICVINHLIEFSFVNILFITVSAYKRIIRQLHTLQKSEQDKLEAELKGLKAQVNPHFLFNTLNMLYSSSLDRDKDLPDNILRLSDNLHYMLHEGVKDEVSIEQEIDFVKDYIVLQEARLSNKVAVDLHLNVDNYDQLIPPLILIPFIENAFKYSSMAKGKKLPISITIDLSEKNLSVKIENIYAPNYVSKQADIWKKSGIGIKNTEKRLAILFSKDYNLDIHNKDNTFIVNLNINLK